MVSYRKVLLAVLVGYLFAARQVLLERRVENQLLPNGVTSELPRELVAPPHLFIVGGCLEDFVVSLLKLVVVVLDSFGDFSHGNS